ncbi:MAG: LytTR family DNA-binding domain-containing protein [Bacteroidota bacterium]
MELRCLVADDEPIARQILENYLAQIPYLTHVGSCKDAFEVMQVLQTQEVDLLFLDINMPKLTGMGLLRSLARRPEVIITTAYAEYAVESFELSVTDYLLKPFSIERFLQAVGKVQQKLAKPVAPVLPPPPAEVPSTTPHHLFVKVDKRMVRVETVDLGYVEAYGNYIKLHMVSGDVLLVGQTLSGFQKRLPDAFLQCHKSFVVNTEHIQSMEGNQLTVGKGVVPVGKSHQASVHALLGLK